MKNSAHNFDDAFLAQILENSQDCIKILDINGKLLYMNKGGQKVMEIDDISACLDNQWVDFWTKSGKESAIDSVEKARKGITSKFSDFCATAKGTPKWWEVTVSPIFNKNNEVSYIVASSHDISSQVGLSGKLQRMVLQQNHENSYRELLSKGEVLEKEIAYRDRAIEMLDFALGLNEDITMVLDRALNYVHVNKMAGEHLMISAEKLIGKNLFDIKPEINNRPEHQDLLRALTGETTRGENFRGPRDQIFSPTYKPIFIDGQVAGVFVKSVKVGSPGTI